MLSLVLALAAAQTPPAAAPAAQAPTGHLRFLPNWTEKLEGKGWPFLDIDPTRTVVLFAKTDSSQAAEPGITRVLVRHEFETDQPDKANPTFRSEVIAEDVDCSTSKVRALNDHRYTGENLTGRETIYRFSDTSWQPVSPDTFDDEVVQAACLVPGAQAAR